MHTCLTVQCIYVTFRLTTPPNVVQRRRLPRQHELWVSVGSMHTVDGTIYWPLMHTLILTSNGQIHTKTHTVRKITQQVLKPVYNTCHQLDSNSALIF